VAGFYDHDDEPSGSDTAEVVLYIWSLLKWNVENNFVQNGKIDAGSLHEALCLKSVAGISYYFLRI
jgi:hypothetical protein